MIESKLSLETLLAYASTGRAPTWGEVESEIVYVAPDDPIEIWDGFEGDVEDPRLFLHVEYSGVIPLWHRDGRRRRKRFSEGDGESPTVVTFRSSYYRMRPVSVVLEGLRVGQEAGPESVRYRVLVCDTDTRLGFPARLAFDSWRLEAEDARVPGHG